MLSPDQVNKLSHESRWDADRIKEFSLVLGAAAISTLNLLEGYLPPEANPENEVVIAGEAWPIDTPEDIYAGEGRRDPVRDPLAGMSYEPSFDPTRTPLATELHADIQGAADISFPEGTQAITIVPEDAKQLPIVPLDKPPAVVSGAGHPEDYTLVR